MPTLQLGIDASKARAGAAEFSRATKEAGQAAGDAAKRTTDLEKGLERTGTKARESARGASELGRETRNLSASEREAELSAARLATTTDKGTEARKRYLEAIRATVAAERQGRNQPAIPTTQLPAGVRGAAVLGGFQNLGSQLGPLGGQLASFTSQAQAAGDSIGAIAGVAGVSSAALFGLGASFSAASALTVAAVSANLEFERSLRGLNALLDSNAESEARRRSIYAQAYRTGQSTEEVARGQEAITRLFRGDADAIERVARAAESFSTATGTQYSAAAQALAQTIDGFKLSSSQAGVVAARLFDGARNGSQEFIPFANALGSLGDEARAAGVSFDQLSVVLSRAASETNLGEATSATRRFLIALTDDTDPATQKLAKLGAEFKRLPDGSRDLAQALGEIQRVTGGQAETLAGIYGNRDFPTVFAALKTNLESVAKAAESADSAIAKLNATAERQQSSNAARFDKFKSSVGSAVDEFGGAIVGLDVGSLVQQSFEALPKILAATYTEAEKVDGAVKKITPGDKALADFGRIQASIAKASEAPVLATDSDARRDAQRAFAAFSNEILRQKPIGFPIEAAIETQPEEIRRAFEAVSKAAGEGATVIDVAKSVSQVSVLIDATKQLESAGKSRSDALRSENATTEAGRTAIDGLIRALQDEHDALGLSARDLAVLKAQRDAERVATASGLTLKAQEIAKIRELAGANADAADAIKKRLDAGARSNTAQTTYKAYVDSLREEVRLLQLSPEERTVDEAVRRAQALADAYREAHRALGADPRTVENLVPDQTMTIEQVRELILRIQELKVLQEQSPIERYGQFIPDAPTQVPDVAAVSPFGPEFDANAAEGQRRLEEIQASLRRERDMVGLSNDARERAIFLRDAEAAAIQAGVQDRDALIESLGREFDEYQRLRDLGQLGQDMGRAVASGFEDAIFQAKSFNDALRDIGREISQLAFRQFVTKPLTDSLGGLFSGLLSGGAGESAGGSGGIFARGGVFDRGELQRFELGGAFHRGSVVPFASGGIFDQPTYFPMSQGRTGLLGEAGPEAIMPLTRGADGKLGVRAESQPSKSVVNNTTHVSMTVVTQNADSFKKSSAQITRDLKKRL